MPCGEFVVKTEGEKRRLIFNCKGCPYGSNIAEYPQCMKNVIERLQEVDADEIVLSEYYERIYGEEQTRILKSVAEAVSRLEAEAVWSPSHLGTGVDNRAMAQRHQKIMLILDNLKTDPFKAYLLLLQELKNETAKASTLTGEAAEDEKVYLQTLGTMRNVVEGAEIITKMKQFLAQMGSLPTDRGLYHSIFQSAIKPSFIGSRIFFGKAEQLQLLDQYEVLGSQIHIYQHPDRIECLYFVNPPEYTLPPEKYFLLEKTKEVVSAHRPSSVGFMDIVQARKYFHKIYVATISDLATRNRISLSVEEKEDLATIVSRYTIGYGILEILLSDRSITDVYIDSPLGDKPIYLVHQKYGQCQTNIIFSDEEARALVSRFRALSGRPFDEAHPILDFDLQDLQTRIAVIGRPMASDGTAFALRLHKETPWTIPQFLDKKMFNQLAAGLFSFLVDAQASMLIVGSRGAGKTSFLQAMMLEIPQNMRIIVQEDSVTGDSKIMVERNGKLEQTTVGRIIDSAIDKYGCENVCGNEVIPINFEGIKVFSMDEKGKIILTQPTQFSRHRVSKKIFEVKTKSGKRIKVTEDHSLFAIGSGGIEPIRTCELVPGSYIATPRKMPLPFKATHYLDGLEIIKKHGKGYLLGGAVKEFTTVYRKEIKSTGKRIGYSKAVTDYWCRKGIIPVKVLCEMKRQLPEGERLFKLDKKSRAVPTGLLLDRELLEFVGLWLADGCYDNKYSVILSVDDNESRNVVYRIAQRLGLTARMHSDGISLMISNENLVFLMKQLLELDGNAYTKKLPPWAFNLSREQTAAFARGLFSGDGYVSKKEVTLGLCSKELIEQIEFLLLGFGILGRRYYTSRDRVYHLRIGGTKFVKAFLEIGFLQEYKRTGINLLSQRTSTHDTLDIIPIPIEMKKKAALSLMNASKAYDYLERGFKFGREKLRERLNKLQTKSDLTHFLEMLSESDIFWDEVESVEKVSDEPVYVYDFSVPSYENFVCENIIAHNTQELPVPFMKRIGFNIQRLKTRPPLGGTAEGEVSAEEALRTALRLGDSVLIIGEVRSVEAKTLFEAMRIGAVGNVVMGTIHGESAYSIWDRIVNDLGVPTTSFKATDFAIVGTQIRFKGTLKRARRIIEITEVLKHWNDDPEEEGGFLEWMRFDAAKDNLDLFQDNLKKSEWIQKIQRNRGLKFEEMWNEMISRGETKNYLVELKNKYSVPRLLEADYSVRAHNKYALMEEKQREEHGSVNHKELLKEWRKWVEESLVRELVAEKPSKGK